MESSEGEQWQKAMDEEHTALVKNDTYDLVLPPKKCKIVKTKWVFKRKFAGDGKIQRYKARLVAKGHTQKKGLDFHDTFAPVARLTSIRVIAAISAYKKHRVYQSDVDSAYLNSLIDTEIYMEQPPGYVQKRGGVILVCCLKKSIYGLKQAGRLWNAMYNDKLMALGFTRSTADPCIYTRTTAEGQVTIGVYVDDTVKTGPEPAIARFNRELAASFSVKELGLAKFIVGVQIGQNSQGTSLTQSTYIKRLVEDLGLEKSRPVYVPISGGDVADLANKETATLTNSTTDNEPVDTTLYRNIIGRIMYAMVGTRPDIAYAVSVLAKYTSRPTAKHLRIAKKLVAYLNTTDTYCMTYEPKDGPVELVGYSDSDWGADKEDRCSIGGYMFLFNGTPVSWRSKKQATVALSSTEAEYMALTAAAKEAVWLCHLLKDLGFEQEGPTTIYEDNQGTITIAQNPCNHERTKHIDIQYHFTRERIESGEIALEYCPTSEQLADLFTKALPRDRFTNLVRKLGLRMLA